MRLPGNHLRDNSFMEPDPEEIRIRIQLARIRGQIEECQRQLTAAEDRLAELTTEASRWEALLDDSRRATASRAK